MKYRKVWSMKELPLIINQLSIKYPVSGCLGTHQVKDFYFKSVSFSKKDILKWLTDNIDDLYMRKTLKTAVKNNSYKQIHHESQFFDCLFN